MTQARTSSGSSSSSQTSRHSKSRYGGPRTAAGTGPCLFSNTRSPAKQPGQLPADQGQGNTPPQRTPRVSAPSRLRTLPWRSQPRGRCLVSAPTLRRLTLAPPRALWASNLRVAWVLNPRGGMWRRRRVRPNRRPKPGPRSVLSSSIEGHRGTLLGIREYASKFCQLHRISARNRLAISGNLFLKILPILSA